MQLRTIFKNGIFLSQARPVYQASALLPFIEQEAMSLYSRAVGIPILHFWRHEHALLLGSRDATLPGVKEVALDLTKQGIAVAVRPFGGLAVALDLGVVNVSMIIPYPLNLDETFWMFAKWLQESCMQEGNVTIGEVDGAYCPGRFDLAIHGVKFAGIAQRRIQDVAIVSAFVNVVHTGNDREGLVETFYRKAIYTQKEWPQFVPTIVRGKVGDLFIERSLDQQYLVNQWMDVVVEHIENEAMRSIILPPIDECYYQEAYKRLIKRLRLQEWIVFDEKM